MKFPRIPHLPFSPQVMAGNTRDDKVAGTGWERYFKKHGLVIMEKMDGSNVALTRDAVVPRGSGVLAPESFDWLKARHSAISHLIPDNIIIYGENMYAVHSIEYHNLESYFYIFGVYDTEYRQWMKPTTIKMWAHKLGFGDPTEVSYKWYQGQLERRFGEMYELRTNSGDAYQHEVEGWVVWANTRIPAHLFPRMVMKWVRKDHVQTDDHWARNWKKAELRK